MRIIVLGWMLMGLSLTTGIRAEVVGHWAMQEGQGQKVIDETGHQEGVLGLSSQLEAEDPVWRGNENPEPRGGLTFRGKQLVLIPHNKAFELTRSFTVELQLLTPAFQSGTLVRINGQFVIDLHAEGNRVLARFVVWPREKGDTPVIVSAATSALEAGRWQRIAGVFDRDNRTLILYLNGQEAARTEIDSQGVSINPMTPLTIGAQIQDKDNSVIKPYTGTLAQVRLSNRALSSDELLSIR